jgi:lysophospholipid acyltransferase (LPLAT)-like uncharacterized protein
MIAPTQKKQYNWMTRILLAIVPIFCSLIVKLICRTYRVTVIGQEHEDQFLNQGSPILFVSWHQGLLYYIYHFRNRNGIVMVSQSKDGELISRIIAMLGFHSARGSSSRGGKEAMNHMIDVINKTHCSGGLVADAPRGPFGVAKMGILKIAQATGLPLIPVMFWARRKILLHNWDNTILPLPFTRIVFFYAAPIFIQPDTSAEQIEKARIDLTDQLNLMHREAREYFGERSGHIPDPTNLPEKEQALISPTS